MDLAIQSAGGVPVVGHHDQRRADLSLHLQQQIDHAGGISRIKRARWLISKNDLRLVDDRSSDRGTLSLSAR
jgi:hypothetical protein